MHAGSIVHTPDHAGRIMQISDMHVVLLQLQTIIARICGNLWPILIIDVRVCYLIWVDVKY